MNVGIFCRDWALGERGGVQVYTQDLVTALSRFDTSGTRYTLLVGAQEAEPALPSDRFATARLPVRGRAGGLGRWADRARTSRLILTGTTRATDPVARALDALGLDVVHFPSTVMPLGVRTPAVVTFFDMQEEFLPEFFSWRERLSRRARNRHAVAEAKIVVSASEFTATCLRERYETPAAKIRVIPPGLDERFRPGAEPGERERLHERYGALPSEFALYPAHPWPHKNHPRLFRALARASRTLSQPVAVVCTGTLGGTTIRLQEMAQESGLAPAQVLDLGFIRAEDLPALYRAARVLVFPSLFEGFGLPVLEALATGCPVLCSGTTALGELAGEMARTIDPLDEREIAEALAAAWITPAPAFDWRAHPRSQLYRWDRAVPRLVAAYAEAAHTAASGN